MAALRFAGESVELHVPRAKGGKAALFRRDPAHGRRISAIPRWLLPAGSAPATVKSGVAHSLGQTAAGRHADLVHDAADAGVVIECRERRHAVGLHWPLSAWRHAADASEAQRAGRI